MALRGGLFEKSEFTVYACPAKNMKMHQNHPYLAIFVQFGIFTGIKSESVEKAGGKIGQKELPLFKEARKTR